MFYLCLFIENAASIVSAMVLSFFLDTAEYLKTSKLGQLSATAWNLFSAPFILHSDYAGERTIESYYTIHEREESVSWFIYDEFPDYPYALLYRWFNHFFSVVCRKLFVYIYLYSHIFKFTVIFLKFFFRFYFMLLTGLLSFIIDNNRTTGLARLDSFNKVVTEQVIDTEEKLKRNSLYAFTAYTLRLTASMAYSAKANHRHYDQYKAREQEFNLFFLNNVIIIKIMDLYLLFRIASFLQIVAFYTTSLLNRILLFIFINF